jgi:hypothetical protein
MKNIYLKICRVIVTLFGVVGIVGVVFASELPNCPGKQTMDDTVYLGWHNCVGTRVHGPNDTTNYAGEWQNGKPNGEGVYTLSNGNTYVGQHKDGYRNGQGTFTVPNGYKYIGEWKDGYRSGQGTYTVPNGFTYVGEWKDGKRNGQGIYTYANGIELEGTWTDGMYTPTKPLFVAKTTTGGDEIIFASSGSGFAVSSDGHVITNNHVIEGCQEVMVHTKQNDIRMSVVASDVQNDLALLKGNFTPSSVFSLSTQHPELLQDIYVAGYPFGNKFSSSVKVTKGIISSLTGLGDSFSHIQIDAALQSGNSGGPILDDMGNVVGVVASKLDAKYMFDQLGIIPENTNFGIKSTVVRDVLNSSSVDTPAASNSPINKSQLGKVITGGTYYISCWRTVAQINKVKSQK